MELNNIYNIDCLEILRGLPNKCIDLAIDDPPYFEGPNLSGYYGRGYSKIGIKRNEYYSGVKNWQVPDQDYFKELQRVSKNQIIWGANHFAGVFNSSGSCWIVWDKVNGPSNFADAELAYTSFKGSVRIFKYMWNGMHQGHLGGDKSKNEKRIHPTQKPIALYKWLLQKFAKPGDLILDPHAGSCSSVIACMELGFDFIACEIDKDLYTPAIRRINDYKKQLKLF